jgi:hypothetical protein
MINSAVAGAGAAGKYTRRIKLGKRFSKSEQ